jgi:hypothetical protein
MKKYLDIERCKQKYAETFNVGENIVIQEKIDGSNASIRYDEESGTLKAFSRRLELNSENTLNGFWDYVQSLNTIAFKEVLGSRYIVFGEWMGAKHAIKYPEDVYGKFWMFDVWDTQTEQYLPYEETRAFYGRLIACGNKEKKFNFVPVFYIGKFESWEKAMELVGKTEVGAEPSGEGIVIKRQDCLDSKSSRLPFYVKIVSEQFSEVHKSKKQKAIDPAAIAKKEANIALAATIVTQQRVQKMLYKFIEDGLLPQDWDEHNLKDISKILPNAIYKDCIKEESETVQQVEDFGKVAAKLSMSIVRDLIK